MHPRYLSFLCLLLTLVSCGGEPLQGPEVARQRALWEPKGWTFVEVCGDSSWAHESSEVRLQGTEPSLKVFAETSGVDGRGPKSTSEKTYAEPGYTYLEVKMSAGFTDCYSIVFKRKVDANDAKRNAAVP